jgi:hypothetical protein
VRTMKTHFKFFSALVIAAFVILYFGLAIAGSATGRIHQVAVVRDVSGSRMVGFIQLDPTTHQGAPSCATVKGRFALDLSTAMGKAAYATAMGVWLTGGNIQVTGAEGPGGSPNCSVWGDTETAYFVFAVWTE